ncbi:hypothetical protein TYRP_000342 [Tyrophagus putrescentiae]|nr:hypothetical protein TYRP_000342 [Tyrophagus putrescentiae]
MNFTTKSTGMKCAQFLLLVLVHCCALSLASIESNGERENKVLTNSAVVNSLTKETVDAQDALAVNKRNVPSDAFLQKMSLSAQSAAPMHASPLELEKARQLCQQLFSYTRPLSLGQRVEEVNGAMRDRSSAVQLQHKHSKRSADYDYSGENSDTFSKKLDFLFANEGIRFKRNNSTGGGNSYLVRLYVQPSTTKPGHLLQRLSRLGTTVAFNPSTVVMSTGTTPSGTTTFTPTSAPPLHSDALASSHSSMTPTTLGNHSMQHFQPRRPTLIGQLLMLRRFGELSNRNYPSSSWMMHSGNNHLEKASPVSAVPALVDADLGNSAEQPTRFVKNLVKKNPFDKEGIRIRFKKSPFDDEGIRYKKSSPFAEEGIRYKKSPFDEEGIRYKKSSPFAEEGIRFKKSPFDDEGIRYKKSPFDAEGIRFKKSPFEAEGIRFKKSPFDAEGIRFKKSPFDDEGIRYKKSPFDDEGIRY